MLQAVVRQFCLVSLPDLQQDDCVLPMWRSNYIALDSKDTIIAVALFAVSDLTPVFSQGLYAKQHIIDDLLIP